MESGEKKSRRDGEEEGRDLALPSIPNSLQVFFLSFFLSSLRKQPTIRDATNRLLAK